MREKPIVKNRLVNISNVLIINILMMWDLDKFRQETWWLNWMHEK